QSRSRLALPVLSVDRYPVAAGPDAVSRRRPHAGTAGQHDDGDLHDEPEQLHQLPLHCAYAVGQALLRLLVHAGRGPAQHPDDHTKSILSFPRINFSGVFNTNPCTCNNDDVEPAVVQRDSDTFGADVASMYDPAIFTYLREGVEMAYKP